MPTLPSFLNLLKNNQVNRITSPALHFDHVTNQSILKYLYQKQNRNHTKLRNHLTQIALKLLRIVLHNILHLWPAVTSFRRIINYICQNGTNPRF